MFNPCGGGRSLHIQHWHSPVRGELEALYRFTGNGPTPEGEGARRGEADAIAKTAIASRQKVKLSGPHFCSVKTLGGLSAKANRRRKPWAFLKPHTDDGGVVDFGGNSETHIPLESSSGWLGLSIELFDG